jgi:hypothetical protein
MKMIAALFVFLLGACAVFHARAATLSSQRALRGNVHSGEPIHDPSLFPNGSNLLPNGTDKNASGMVAPAFVAENSLEFAACHINPQSCKVNAAKVSTELGERVVLLYGCSIDIFALDYFCKAASSPVVGFARNPNTYGNGNLAYCRIGAFTLAYSFNPGSGGPPYYAGCEAVLHRSCAQVSTQELVKNSVAQIVADFGRPPTAIVVDSSLWDAASWWSKDGKPPEPYVAPAAHVNKWCVHDIPTLLHTVQLNSPTSRVAFRTAPRVEFAAGYGHSMQNIEAMNACFRQGSTGVLNQYMMFDYNALIEQWLVLQGGQPSTYFEDAFHPGVLPSVQYIDWILRWVKTLPEVS